MVSTNNRPTIERDIIIDAVKVCKPYLKYFPGFTTIGEMLNESATTLGYYEFVTDERVVDFPEGISFKTKCRDIECFHEKDDYSIPDQRKNNGDGLNTERMLVLTQEGVLLERYRRDYRITIMPGTRYTGHRHVVVECRFSIVDGKRLLELLEKHKGYFTKRILDELSELADKGIEERISRLQKMQGVKMSLQKIQERIKT